MGIGVKATIENSIHINKYRCRDRDRYRQCCSGKIISEYTMAAKLGDLPQKILKLRRMGAAFGAYPVVQP